MAAQTTRRPRLSAEAKAENAALAAAELAATPAPADPAEAAVIEKAVRRRGAAKTGNPATDRKANAAKAAAGKAPEKAAPAPAKPKAEKVAPKLPTGYEVRWPKGAFDLAKKGEGASEDGPAWLVICTAHGTTTGAATTTEANSLGRKTDRAGWCKKCAADAAAK